MLETVDWADILLTVSSGVTDIAGSGSSFSLGLL